MSVLLGFQTVRASAILGCDFMDCVYSVNVFIWKVFIVLKTKYKLSLTSNSHTIFFPTLISYLLNKKHVFL